jgi:hypothetical protein
VRVDYQSPCADGGILSEWFAPGVGLVRRAENSIAGPVVSDLAQAEVGDVVYPRLPYSTTLALDSPLYINNLKPIIPPAPLPTVRGLLILRNRSSDPIEFNFGGCRSATIEVVDDLGQVVEQVKADDGGCCVCRNITQVVLADDTLTLPFSFTLQGSDGRPLTGARYRVVGTFDTFDPPSLRPSASATFDVRSLR